jgi:hypothetical protein
MSEATTFYPSRRTGLLVQIPAALLLLGGSAVCFWLSTRQQVGSSFLFLLLVALLLLVPFPLVAYRIYALLQSDYTIDRESLTLRWGLRSQIIPLNDVEWLRPANELGFHLPIPPLSWPGAYLGSRSVEGLGLVEFMAASEQNMVLVATPERIYVVSPVQIREFIITFLRSAELGSLRRVMPMSSRPAAFLAAVWNDRLARWMLMLGVGFTLSLFMLVSLIIPGLSQVSLGFDVNGQPLNPGPPESLLLLPVLAGLVTALDVVLGMYFYRHENQRLAGYFLWASSSLTPILLIFATLFIAR